MPYLWFLWLCYKSISSGLAIQETSKKFFLPRFHCPPGHLIIFMSFIRAKISHDTPPTIKSNPPTIWTYLSLRSPSFSLSWFQLYGHLPHPLNAHIFPTFPSLHPLLLFLKMLSPLPSIQLRWHVSPGLHSHCSSSLPFLLTWTLSPLIWPIFLVGAHLFHLLRGWPIRLFLIISQIYYLCSVFQVFDTVHSTHTIKIQETIVTLGYVIHSSVLFYSILSLIKM